MPRWQQYNIELVEGETPLRRLHFADLGGAEGCWIHARRLAAEGAAAALDRGSGYTRQARYVFEAAMWLGAGYRMDNISPICDPAYRLHRLAFTGATRAARREDALGQRVGPSVSAPPLGPPAGPAGLFRPDDPNRALAPAPFTDVTLGGASSDRFRRWWRDLGKGDLDQNGVCELPVRIDLAHNPFGDRSLPTTGVPIVFCDGENGDGHSPNGTPFNSLPPCAGFGGLFVGCAEWPSSAEGCDPYTWRTVKWHDPPPAPWDWDIPLVGSLSLDAPVCRVRKALLPLRWSLEWIYRVADACIQRGPRGVILESLLFAMVRNLSTAGALGRLPDELEVLAQQLPSNLGASAWAPERWGRSVFPDDLPNVALTRNAAALAWAGVQQVPVLGVVAGAAQAILGLLPSAVGDPPVDEFGRATPVFEVPVISDSITSPPRDNVPEPPGFDRSTWRDRPAPRLPGRPRPTGPIMFDLDEFINANLSSCSDWLGMSPDSRVSMAEKWLEDHPNTGSSAAEIIRLVNARCAETPPPPPVVQQPQSARGNTALWLAALAVVSGGLYVGTRPGGFLASKPRSNPDELSPGAMLVGVAALGVGAYVFLKPSTANAATIPGQSQPPALPPPTTPAAVAAQQELTQAQRALQEAETLAQAARDAAARARAEATASSDRNAAMQRDAAAKQAAADRAAASDATRTAKLAAAATARQAAQQASAAAAEAAARAARAEQEAANRTAAARSAAATAAAARTRAEQATSAQPAPSQPQSALVSGSDDTRLHYYFLTTAYGYGYSDRQTTEDVIIRNLESRIGLPVTGAWHGISTVSMLVEDIRRSITPAVMRQRNLPRLAPATISRAAVDAINRTARDANANAPDIGLIVTVSG